MAFSRVLVLDCGASRAVAGVFSYLSAGRVRLDEFALAPLPAEACRDEKWSDHAIEALRTLRGKLKAGAPVILGLPGHLTLTKFVRTPRVEPAKRKKIIRFEAQQNIPYALTDVVWDNLIVAEEAADIEVMFCAAKLDSVEALCNGAEQAGFLPRALQAATLATLGAFRLAQPASTAPAVIVNIGARSTTIVFAEKQRFFARTLALAGSNITQTLADESGFDFAQSEAFKLAAFSGKADPAVTKVAGTALQHGTEAFTSRLIQEITRSAINYRRHAGADHPAKLYLTGGGSLVPDLPALLSAKLKLPVERFDPLKSIEISPRAAAADAAAHAVALADLVGLAAAQFPPQRLTLDLLPPRLHRLEEFRRRERWLVLAGLLTAAALVPPIRYFHDTAQAAQRDAEAIESQLVPLRELDARNRANLERLEQTRREVELLDSVYASRATWLQLFSDLQDRLVKVEDVWLDRLQLLADAIEEVPASEAQPAADANAQTAAPDPNAPPVTPSGISTTRSFKIALSGRLLDTVNPLSKVSADSYRRVKTLLAGLAESRFVRRVENERFDNTQPGILRFDFVLTVDPRKKPEAPR
jgi:type IV pilus assembly protein PilM